MCKKYFISIDIVNSFIWKKNALIDFIKKKNLPPEFFFPAVIVISVAGARTFRWGLVIVLHIYFSFRIFIGSTTASKTSTIASKSAATTPRRCTCTSFEIRSRWKVGFWKFTEVVNLNNIYIKIWLGKKNFKIPYFSFVFTDMKCASFSMMKHRITLPLFFGYSTITSSATNRPLNTPGTNDTYFT